MFLSPLLNFVSIKISILYLFALYVNTIFGSHVIMFSNATANLCFHKKSLKGKIQDYVISFNTEQQRIEDVIDNTLELIEKLIASCHSEKVYGRLIAKVNFTHVNFQTNVEEIRAYHFPSFSSQLIENVKEFFISHMTKIASRLDTFNKHGSNLMIKNIEHIHIQLSC